MKDNKWTHKVTLLTFWNLFEACDTILYIFKILSGIWTPCDNVGYFCLFQGLETTGRY